MNEKAAQGTGRTGSPALASVSGSGADNFVTPDEAYNQGWGARMLGKTKAANPYLESTDPWKWFNAGWDESEP